MIGLLFFYEEHEFPFYNVIGIEVTKVTDTSIKYVVNVESKLDNRYKHGYTKTTLIKKLDKYKQEFRDKRIKEILDEQDNE